MDGLCPPAPAAKIPCSTSGEFKINLWIKYWDPVPGVCWTLLVRLDSVLLNQKESLESLSGLLKVKPLCKRKKNALHPYKLVICLFWRRERKWSSVSHILSGLTTRAGGAGPRLSLCWGYLCASGGARPCPVPGRRCSEIGLMCPHRCEGRSGLCKAEPKWGAEWCLPRQVCCWIQADPSPGSQPPPEGPDSPGSAVRALGLGLPLPAGADGRSWGTSLSSVSRIPSWFWPLQMYRMATLETPQLQCLCLLMPMEQSVVSHWSL